MASEKKACESMETAVSEAHEEEKQPPFSPQSLVRKLLKAANKELVGWKLDCQAKVSKRLTS